MLRFWWLTAMNYIRMPNWAIPELSDETFIFWFKELVAKSHVVYLGFFWIFDVLRWIVNPHDISRVMANTDQSLEQSNVSGKECNTSVSASIQQESSDIQSSNCRDILHNTTKISSDPTAETSLSNSKVNIASSKPKEPEVHLTPKDSKPLNASIGTSSSKKKRTSFFSRQFSSFDGSSPSPIERFQSAIATAASVFSSSAASHNVTLSSNITTNGNEASPYTAKPWH